MVALLTDSPCLDLSRGLSVFCRPDGLRDGLAAWHLSPSSGLRTLGSGLKPRTSRVMLWLEPTLESTLHQSSGICTGCPCPGIIASSSPLLFPAKIKHFWIWREHKQKVARRSLFRSAAPTLYNRLPGITQDRIRLFGDSSNDINLFSTLLTLP